MRIRSQLPRSAELVVIGGGIIGAATVFFARRAGLDAVLLERRPQVCTLTTSVAAGGFRLQLEHHDELRLVRRSAELFEQFAEETGQVAHDAGVRHQGYLWLTCDPARVDAQRSLVERQRGWGVDGVELLSGDEARDRFPWLSPDIVQARFRAGDGLIDPKRITMGLLEGSSATVVTDCDVVGFSVERGRLCGLKTSRGAIAAGRCVVACGPLSAPLTARAGVSLPVQAVRRQRVTLWHVPQVPRDAPMTIDEDTTAHWRPVARGGAFLLYPDAAEPAAEPIEDVPADPRFAFALLDPSSPTAVARTVPFWREVWEQNEAAWAVQAGQYTMTPDQRPLIGATEIDGLYVNTGYSGHGVMAGPAGGELLAQILMSSRVENPFRLDRPLVPSTQAF